MRTNGVSSCNAEVSCIMIEFTKGNILESDADYIVVPVNCVGRPGRGLAKQWADSAPARVVLDYIQECLAHKLEPGSIRYYTDSTYILATTKDHWMHRSQIEWIETICDDLAELARKQKWFPIYDQSKYITVAVPKLGCGLGGLRWSDVKPIFIKYFEQSPTLFLVYE